MAHKRAKLDSWSLKAKKEGYPARSVYKLKEMDDKFRLIRKGMKILDVGAAPGSWTLYALRKLGGSGLVAAVDLKPLTVKSSKGKLYTHVGDIFSEEAQTFLEDKGPYDFIMSDAAPNTSGNRLVDTRKSYDLVEMILNLSVKHLAPGGNFTAKIFQGGDEEELFEWMKQRFKTVKRSKPKAVRPESFESYFIGLGFLGEAPSLAD